MRRDRDRAQSFTLEGFVGAIVILTAVLFATQSIVVTPGADGESDSATRDRLQQEATDVLVATADRERRDLSYVVRYWDPDERRFSGAIDRTVGYGTAGAPNELFGDALGQAFGARGYSYNVELFYRNATTARQTDREVLVWMGSPNADAVSASHPVTLYDDMTLTARTAGTQKLESYDDDPAGSERFYPIADAAPESPVYNVVEVRLTVW